MITAKTVDVYSQAEQDLLSHVTLVFNCVHYTKEERAQVTKTIAKLQKAYPTVTIIAGVPKLNNKLENDSNSTFLYYDDK